ncbi:hypothetical protein, partial [Rickettsiales endosymbiont of Peranema trichophorum]|uniref:hypothetical protein n=1 Tax=Rickettsiales endosymbiont of Peranema trichophorum TaxID=2486577 RepID=UPI0013EEC831
AGAGTSAGASSQAKPDGTGGGVKIPTTIVSTTDDTGGAIKQSGAATIKVYTDLSGTPDDRASKSSGATAGTTKPTIQLFARDVENTKGLFKHSFSIITYSDGRKEIVTGLLEERTLFGMVIKDLDIHHIKYVDENRETLGLDWKEKADRNNIKHILMQEFSFQNDYELGSYVDKGIKGLQALDKQDYDICSTDRCWGGNSNTVQKYFYDAMGLKLNIPEQYRLPNALGLSQLPGIDGTFYKGALEKGYEALKNTPEAIGKTMEEYGKQLAETDL